MRKLIARLLRRRGGIIPRYTPTDDVMLAHISDGQLPSGVHEVFNAHQRPEPVLTESQWRKIQRWG